jgi:hypothetical protein
LLSHRFSRIKNQGQQDLKVLFEPILIRLLKGVMVMTNFQILWGGLKKTVHKQKFSFEETILNKIYLNLLKRSILKEHIMNHSEDEKTMEWMKKTKKKKMMKLL